MVGQPHSSSSLPDSHSKCLVRKSLWAWGVLGKHWPLASSSSPVLWWESRLWDDLSQCCASVAKVDGTRDALKEEEDVRRRHGSLVWLGLSICIITVFMVCCFCTIMFKNQSVPLGLFTKFSRRNLIKAHVLFFKTNFWFSKIHLCAV